jgi:predicted phage terminase large subunit-like protein
LASNTINPDFELFYQQGRGRGARMAIKAEHFALVNPQLIAGSSVILSIDPNQRGGANSSHAVIQAWSPHNGSHVLVEQWREQCIFDRLKSVYWWFVRHFRPSVVLIENTANGPALISDARRRSTPIVVEITPDGRSKAARLLVHVPLIRRSHILLPETATWRAGFVKEFIEFPASAFDDQVDATTQYLDWITANGAPAPRPQRGIAGGAASNGARLLPGGSYIAREIRGAVSVRLR